jgi:hypothetical protein
MDFSDPRVLGPQGRIIRAGLAINVSGVIRISLKNEHGSLKSDQNFLWAVFNGEQE